MRYVADGTMAHVYETYRSDMIIRCSWEEDDDKSRKKPFVNKATFMNHWATLFPDVDLRKGCRQVGKCYDCYNFQSGNCRA
jgi:hypothetical protein